MMSLTSEHYQSIGEIVVVWAKLEIHIVKVLRTLSRMTFKEALVVYLQMGFREKLTVLRGLLIAKEPNKEAKVRKEFEALAKRLESAYSNRNLVAHSIWFPGAKDGEISAFGFDTKIQKIEGRDEKRNSFNAAAFHKQAMAIDRLAEDFKAFFEENFKVSFIHKKQGGLD
ncbi:hypothetical protein [Undibacterium sp. Ji49W]|uniref:hypothetical protein n=1 Tax=Undibacterium sp. Ji49W TaxID=3413040 RepID=UPI003BF1BBA9